MSWNCWWMKVGKLTSWGNSSLSPLFFRVLAPSKRWLFGISEPSTESLLLFLLFLLSLSWLCCFHTMAAWARFCSSGVGRVSNWDYTTPRGTCICAIEIIVWYINVYFHSIQALHNIDTTLYHYTELYHMMQSYYVTDWHNIMSTYAYIA